jgi:hypothetical protein
MCLGIPAQLVEGDTGHPGLAVVGLAVVGLAVVGLAAVDMGGVGRVAPPGLTVPGRRAPLGGWGGTLRGSGTGPARSGSRARVYIVSNRTLAATRPERH